MDAWEPFGRHYLSLYLALFGVALLIRVLVRAGLILSRPAAVAPSAQRHLQDPYHVANLRGGAWEVRRLLFFVLCERGWLASSGYHLCAKPGAAAIASHALERVVLEQWSRARSMKDREAMRALDAAIESHASALRTAGLVVDERERTRRKALFRRLRQLLLLATAIRVFVGLQQGDVSSLWFVALMLGSWLMLACVQPRPRTRAGTRALREHRANLLPRRLPLSRSEAFNNVNYAQVTAAAFGFASLRSADYPWVRELKRLYLLGEFPPD